jgi:hypothetical protein
MRHHCLHLLLSILAFVSCDGEYNRADTLSLFYQQEQHNPLRQDYPLSLHLNEDLSLVSSRTISFKNSSRIYSIDVITSDLQQQHLRRRRRRRGLQEEKVPSSTALKAFYYFIQALGRSNNSSCNHPQPSFIASCPVGAFIATQSSRSEWNSRLDCVQLTETQIRCSPKELGIEDQFIDLNDRNGVTMACYGSVNGDDADENYENLQVSVQVESGTYTCGKAIHAFEDPIPTVVAGGNVYQTVAIQKQCYSPGQEGEEEAWVFVEPTCGVSSSGTSRDSANQAVLRQSAVPIHFGNTDKTNDEAINRVSGIPPTVSISHCDIEDDCRALYMCSNRTCSGTTSCDVAMPGFVTNSTSEITVIFRQEDECLPRDFVLDLEIGHLCEFNLMCSSGICIAGTCRADRLDDHEPCDEHADCKAYACGKHPEVNATAEDIRSDNIPLKICCPSGKTFGHEGDPFCKASQPIGAACKADAMCESDICIFDTCRKTLLNDGMECEESTDCNGGVCAIYHDAAGKRECCPTGKSIILSDGPTCSNRTAGDACENNSNSLCQSNICVQGVCKDSPQKVGAACDNHYDCANWSCALQTAFPAAPFICCPSGSYMFVPQPEEVVVRTSTGVVTSNSLRVCTGQPFGAPCSAGEQEHDDLCDSGICIFGFCRDNRQIPGDACAEDEDCENGVCAFVSLEDGASKVCCESNDHQRVYLPDRLRLTDVCTGQPLGARCGDNNTDAVCQSGNCADGVCVKTPAILP